MMSVCSVVGRGCLLWPVCSLDKTLLAFALLHFAVQGQTCLSLQISLDFLLLHSSPLWWKWHIFWVLVLEGLVVVHRTSQPQPCLHHWLGHRLGLLEWMVCLGNELRYFCFFEIAPKYCILDSFVDYESCSISSKEFLPIVVDVMVVWIKFIHSHPF